MSYLGNTYALKDLTAWDIEGREIKINGKYTVEDYQPYEPAAGIISSYFTLFPEHSDDELQSVTVDTGDLEWAIEPGECQRREDQMEEACRAADEAEERQLERERTL